MKYLLQRLIRLWFSGIFLAMCPPLINVAHAIEVVEPARAMAAQCSQCHSMEGNNNEGFERLNGESFNEIYEELMEMRNSNKNELMHRQAKGYSEEQIWALANYFSGQSEARYGGSTGKAGEESHHKTESHRSEDNKKKDEKSRRQKRDD